MTTKLLSLRAPRSNLGQGSCGILTLPWPVDLGLTVASHGWVHLEPWRWEPERGRLARSEQIGGRIGTIGVRQTDPTALTVDWQGFTAKDEPEILRRVRRWVSADWDPGAAVAAVAPALPGEAAVV